MARAVPFAGNLVRDFQYEHFRYWNVPPRWDKIADEHGTFVLVPKMSHRKKKVEKRQIWLFSYFCSGDPTLDVSVIAWLVTGMSHQSDTRVVTTWLVNKMSHRKKNLYDGLYERSYFWKMSKIISIFDQKIGVYEGIFAFWRPGRPLRCQKFYQETSIWSSGYVPRVKK